MLILKLLTGGKKVQILGNIYNWSLVLRFENMHFCLFSSIKIKICLSFQRSFFPFAPTILQLEEQYIFTETANFWMFLQSVSENFASLKFLLLKWLVLFVCGWKARVEEEKKVPSISLKSLFFLLSFSILYCFFTVRKKFVPDSCKKFCVKSQSLH